MIHNKSKRGLKSFGRSLCQIDLHMLIFMLKFIDLVVGFIGVQFCIRHIGLQNKEVKRPDVK